VEIRIEGSDLPGLGCGAGHNVHVAIQRRGRPDELLGLVPGDAPSARWTLDCTPIEGPDGVDLKGPYIQGSPGARFIYLSWVTVDAVAGFRLLRRAKLWLDAVPPAVLEQARELGLLVGRLGLTDRKGNPRCAAVRPPVIEWSAESPSGC
jgi:hypothetical protein